jgi:hypothetical protein
MINRNRLAKFLSNVSCRNTSLRPNLGQKSFTPFKPLSPMVSEKKLGTNSTSEAVRSYAFSEASLEKSGLSEAAQFKN